LKGHGFSGAAKRPKSGAALAAEGMPAAEDAIPQGLEPKNQNAGLAARLKSCPFKAPARARRR
jgi:hypothetical protein